MHSERTEVGKMGRQLACIIFLTLVKTSTCMISNRRELIEGSITAVTPDLVRIPPEDRVPYVVALGLCDDSKDGPKPSTIVCGASLIHPNFALTAAHCLQPKPDGPIQPTSKLCIIYCTSANKNLTAIVSGDASPEDFTISKVKESILHESYEQLSYRDEFHITNDVALLLLDQPLSQPALKGSYLVDQTTNPGFVLLPNPLQYWDNWFYPFPVLVAGWGLDENATVTDNKTGGGLSNDPEPSRLTQLRYTIGAAHAADFCRMNAIGSVKNAADAFKGEEKMAYLGDIKYEQTIYQPDDTYCVAWNRAQKEYIQTTDDSVLSSVCKGDSGGPAYLPSQVAHVLGFQGDVQLGVISYGPPCGSRISPEADKEWPTTVANVAMKVPWIHQQIEKRGYTPLKVATSPVRWSYIGAECSIKEENCYVNRKDDVMNPDKESYASVEMGMVGDGVSSSGKRCGGMNSLMLGLIFIILVVV